MKIAALIIATTAVSAADSGKTCEYSDNVDPQRKCTVATDCCAIRTSVDLTQATDPATSAVYTAEAAKA